MENGFLSNLKINNGDRVVLIFLVSNDNTYTIFKDIIGNQGQANQEGSTMLGHIGAQGKQSNGLENSFKLNKPCLKHYGNYEPLFLPVFGTYDGIGDLSIDRDPNVSIIEEFFGLDIEKLILNLLKKMIGKPTKVPESQKYFDKLYYTIEHEFYYQSMVNISNSDKHISNGRITRYFIDNILPSFIIEKDENEFPKPYIKYNIPNSEYHLKSYYNFCILESNDNTYKSNSIICPQEFFNLFLEKTGIDLTNNISNSYKEISNIEWDYNLYEGIASNCVIMPLSHKVRLKQLSNKKKNVLLTDDELREYNSLVSMSIHIDIQHSKELLIPIGESMFSVEKNTSGSRTKLYSFYDNYKDGLFYSKLIKNNLLDFLKFDSTMEKMSFDYKLSNIISDDVNIKDFLYLNNQVKLFLEKQM